MVAYSFFKATHLEMVEKSGFFLFVFHLFYYPSQLHLVQGENKITSATESIQN